MGVKSAAQRDNDQDKTQTISNDSSWLQVTGCHLMKSVVVGIKKNISYLMTFSIVVVFWGGLGVILLILGYVGPRTNENDI